VDLDVTLNLPGIHNVLNSLAAIAVALEVGVKHEAIVAALAEFEGVGRRFQRYGEITLPYKSPHLNPDVTTSHSTKPASGQVAGYLPEGEEANVKSNLQSLGEGTNESALMSGSFTLIDDYGHHPVEMAATLAAVRGAFPGKRLVLAFQPHRYTRTRDVFDDFVKVLGTVDALVLSEVYAAGEPAIVAADGRALMQALRVAGQTAAVFVEQIADMPQAIMHMARDGDVVVTMGAGTIGNVPQLLVNAQAK
jgi:UDP-N-acetylmuramate--alanine ligase